MNYSLLLQLGYELKDDQVETIFWRFKAVAEQKKVIKASNFLSLLSLSGATDNDMQVIRSG